MVVIENQVRFASMFPARTPQRSLMVTDTDMVEMVERVTKAILPAFDHIPDPEYRKTIAMCWARAALEAMREPTDEMISAGLSVTAAWHDLPGSALTVNREKMRMRYAAMLKIANRS